MTAISILLRKCSANASCRASGALLAATFALVAGAPSAAIACPNESLREQQHSTFLPDCRAYEMVSPAEKNGGEVMTDSTRTRVAVDGSAAAFASLVGFGDTAGMGVTSEYMAERSVTPSPGDSGWGTHGITPKQEPLSVTAVGETYETKYAALSSTLESGVFQAWSPLTEDPYVANVPDLYERRDLRSAGPGAYALLSACTLCESTGTPLPGLAHVRRSGYPWVTDATDDSSHVLFESTLRLAPGSNADATVPIYNVYESDGGVTRLVSLVPASGSECADPACVVPNGGASAGQGTYKYVENGAYTPNVLSAGGTRAIFTTSPNENLYLREFGQSPGITVQINASERSKPEAQQPAVYWTASSDDSRIFFTTAEQLTETAGGGLYMYDLTAPAGKRLTLIGSAAYVVGASENGHRLYFVSRSQLVAGQPSISGEGGLFLWSDASGAPGGGELTYIGEVTAGSGDDSVADPKGAPTRQARVSTDGRYLLFASAKGTNLLGLHGGTDYNQGACELESNKANGCRELYLYDAVTNQLSCASCRPDGLPPKSNAETYLRTNIGGTQRSTTYENRALSLDGRRVFFSTDEALVAQDTNGVSDAYEYDSQTQEVHLLSTGESTDPSYFMDASATGEDVFIATRERLVGWDVDRGYDLYDVRVSGGFPEPPLPPPTCQGDACQPPPTALIDTTPGTLTFEGPSNPTVRPVASQHKKDQPKRGHHKRNHRHKRKKGNKRHVAASRRLK